MPAPSERYQKQLLFADWDADAQEKLQSSSVLLCGCGALGTVIAETLVRAGVGTLRIVDRDFVELSNLQRQVLFDETDIESQLPKAIAATEKLRKINSTVSIDPHVADIDHTNIAQLAEGVDLILDGTDNFEVRFLINDYSLEANIPWIYGGVIGAHGQTMTIFPHETACLRCLIERVPEPGSVETCDTAGVLGPAVNVVSSLECIAAMKVLSGKRDAIEPVLTIIDVWDGSLRKMNMKILRERGDCPACHKGERLWLDGREGSHTVVLCGRNAVQVSPPAGFKMNLDEMNRKLQSSASVTQNRFLLKAKLNDSDHEITLFPDGRAIIKGTDEISEARTLYARYIGS
ncbi:MAG: ThiF family adenylyltransferase [Planctomycetaceae bacterium]|nr:ThiF family adenylyltransferase [Planctomycetaceae bacterium]